MTLAGWLDIVILITMYVAGWLVVGFWGGDSPTKNHLYYQFLPPPPQEIMYLVSQWLWQMWTSLMSDSAVLKTVLHSTHPPYVTKDES